MTKLIFKITKKIPSIMTIENEVSKSMVFAEIRNDGFLFYYNHFYYNNYYSCRSFIKLNKNYFKRLELYKINESYFLYHVDFISREFPPYMLT